MKYKTKVQKRVELIPFSSKGEVLRILKDENCPKSSKHKYHQIEIILEIKKASKEYGVFKGEYYESGKMEYKGSLLVPLDENISNKNDYFSKLRVGQSHFYGLALASREAKVPEKVLGFFRKSFKDAKIQDFIPFIGKSGMGV